MKYENHIELDNYGAPKIKGTETGVAYLLHMLSLGNSVDEVISEHPEISIQDVYACLEYAGRLVLVNNYLEASKKINENYEKRLAIAAKIRAMETPPELYDLT